MALLVLLLAASAFAGDEADVTRLVEEALARNDRAAALAILEAVVLPDAPRDRERSIAAARAALDLVKGPDGDLAAARILIDALGRERSNATLHTMAMGLKARARQEFDLPVQEELLRGFVLIYPEQIEFREQLARLFLDSGRTGEARDEYRRIIALAPSARDPRFTLALLYEQEGDLAGAVRVYDDLIELRANDPNPDLFAHQTKVRLLLFIAHDFAAARKAFDAAVAAATASEPGRVRDEYLSRFESLRVSLDMEQDRRKRLRELRSHLHVVLWGTAAAWALVLGGGLTWLRRVKWI